MFLNLKTARTSALIFFTSRFLSSVASMSTTTPSKIIDSHLHVWANTKESAQFPYAQDPPDSLKDQASTRALLNQMETAGVDGALIVQPINHRFDHSYVTQAIKEHPTKFKGMLLHDPALPEKQAVSRLEELALKGFVGVRYNPYLWDKVGEQQWSKMSEGGGLAVYKRCGELGMPVGVMCFQGLQLHYEDICQLIERAPETKLILDHFGFTSIKNDAAFDQLLQLAKYPTTYVKISALFRLDDTSPYNQVFEKRFVPLLEAYGADRLLYGSDFPFVLEQKEEYKMVDLVASWCKDDATKAAIMGGTCERLFGAWG